MNTIEQIDSYIDGKTYLARKYGQKLGRVKVTGYCIRFASLDDVDRQVLAGAIRDRLAA